MNKKFILLFLPFILMGCSPTLYTELFHVSPVSQVKTVDNDYVFENDTVRITYDFWAPHGTLLLTVHNKLKVPLYIDWWKSALIRNDENMNIWNDAETSYTSSYSSRSSTSVLLGASVSTTSSQTQVKERPERISFIAPGGEVTKSRFQLIPYNGIGLSKEKVKIGGDKNAAVCYAQYKADESTLLFRNYLSYSTSEDFARTSSIDLSFYVDKISLIPHEKFITIYNKDTIDTKSFYIHLAGDVSKSLANKYLKK